jgi:hypothetical protein
MEEADERWTSVQYWVSFHELLEPSLRATPECEGAREATAPHEHDTDWEDGDLDEQKAMLDARGESCSMAIPKGSFLQLLHLALLQGGP